MISIQVLLLIAFVLGMLISLTIFKKLFLNQVFTLLEDIQKLKNSTNDLHVELTKNITDVIEIKFFMMRQKEELDEFSDVLEVKFRKITESLERVFEMRQKYENEIIKLKKILERKEKMEKKDDSN